MNLGDNPVIRMLAVIVLVAMGIRLVFLLLEPVWPYLLVVLIVFSIFQFIRWYRDRW